MRTLGLRILSLAGLAVGTCLAAGELSFKVTTDRPDPLYQPGEKIVFSIQLQEDGKPVAGRTLRWQRRGDDQQEVKGELTSQTEPVSVTTALETPGFVRLTITAQDGNGQALKDAKGNELTFEGGAGVAPEKLQTLPEPQDFDAFWQNQRNRLAEVPMKVETKPVAVKTAGLVGLDVKVDCAGGKPVSGYFVKPQDAAPRSLPALISFHGYGVHSAILREDPKMLTLDVNAHGIENGQPATFYEALSKGELKDYALSNNDTPEKSYFLGMFLRVMRALQFIEAQPEWDGVNLIVSGGSQGGLQALVAAGLDPRVTFCMACMPWCCDLGGITLGRQRGWRPEYTPALGYFDPANHVKRAKAAVLVDAGLGDYVCPPSGVTAMFNNIPSADKTLVYIQGATHGYTPPGSRTAWSEYAGCLARALARGGQRAAAAEPERLDLFVGGQDGYACYRIPALLATPKGTLLAFCEGRKFSAMDESPTDMVMKRSLDGGRTWLPLQVVVKAVPEAAMDPCPVLDRNSGTVVLVYDLWPEYIKDTWPKDYKRNPGLGRDSVTAWVTRSGDEGATWSTPVDITAMAKKPAWSNFIHGPGVGIQMRSGRMVIPCCYQMGAWRNFAIYSDDHGTTWQLSDNEVGPGVDESQVVERSDGTLVLNMRSSRGKGCRAESTSADGGKTWSELVDRPELPEPVCQGSILRYTWADPHGRSRILFSNPGTAKGRDTGTVRLSYDEGATWPVARVIQPGYFGYSCLAVLPDWTICCLFENDGCGKATFVRFTLDWLTDGKDRMPQ